MCRCSDPAIFILTYLFINDKIRYDKINKEEAYDISEK